MEAHHDHPHTARLSLAGRLEGRRGEIEQTVLARVYSVADPTEAGDPQYVEGLRAAVSAALGYGLAGIEAGDAAPGPIPAELFVQARSAARNGVSLDTVIRRYLAGHALLGDFAMQEAREAQQLGAEEIHNLTRVQAALLDRLVAAIADEYRSEIEARPRSVYERRAELVRRLLDGELLDTSEFNYDFEGHHLGAIAVGSGAREAIRDLAAVLDRRLLSIRLDEGMVWAWLGATRPFEREQLDDLSALGLDTAAAVAFGEPAQGLLGWRLTHRQAAAALPIARRAPTKITRYADVALLAAVVQDEVLSTSLRDIYLAPLAADRDDGATLRQTLRAYFAAERNVSSTASALGVDRKTVTSRLRATEERLGRSLGVCAAELEAALRLEQLNGFAGARGLT